MYIKNVCFSVKKKRKKERQEKTYYVTDTFQIKKRSIMKAPGPCMQRKRSTCAKVFRRNGISIRCIPCMMLYLWLKGWTHSVYQGDVWNRFLHISPVIRTVYPNYNNMNTGGVSLSPMVIWSDFTRNIAPNHGYASTKMIRQTPPLVKNSR